jgi:hypothetical protein
VPKRPEDAEDQARPEGRETALKERQGQPPPAKFFDGAEEQGERQRRQRLVPGREGMSIGNCRLTADNIAISPVLGCTGLMGLCGVLSCYLAPGEGQYIACR